MLVKTYGIGNEPDKPLRLTVTPNSKSKIIGNPKIEHISTSFAERQNLTMRMSMRRFTRSTNGFSKKVENHAQAVALHFLYYNFGRVHKTLRVTPAMEAGIANHIWTLEEIAALLDKNSN